MTGDPPHGSRPHTSTRLLASQPLVCGSSQPSQTFPAPPDPSSPFVPQRSRARTPSSPATRAPSPSSRRARRRSTPRARLAAAAAAATARAGAATFETRLGFRAGTAATTAAGNASGKRHILCLAAARFCAWRRHEGSTRSPAARRQRLDFERMVLHQQEPCVRPQSAFPSSRRCPFLIPRRSSLVLFCRRRTAIASCADSKLKSHYL